MQDNNNVQNHYNNLKTVSQAQRKLSKILNIRNMNNFIKSVLIRKYGKHGQRILDLGCGRGGDMKKHFANKPSCFYGVDIAEYSILEAEERYNKYKKSEHKNEDSKQEMDVKFIALDAYHQKFDLNLKFDLISCQFSLHYAFASQETFETSIKNITNHLEDSGYFIATIPNSEVLLRRYAKYGNDFGNEYYKIIFTDSCEDIKKRESKFGIKYVFELKEAVDNCVEYLVDYKLLVDAFKDYDYEFVEFKDFMTFFNKNHSKYKDLSKLMPKKRLNKDELKVVELYSVIVFRKK